jgi:hypothetical protein
MRPNLDVFFGLLADAQKTGRRSMKDADMIQVLVASGLSEAEAAGLLAKLDAERLPPGEERNQAAGDENIRKLRERARQLSQSS